MGLGDQGCSFFQEFSVLLFLFLQFGSDCFEAGVGASIRSGVVGLRFWVCAVALIPKLL